MKGAAYLRKCVNVIMDAEHSLTGRHQSDCGNQCCQDLPHHAIYWPSSTGKLANNTYELVARVIKVASLYGSGQIFDRAPSCIMKLSLKLQFFNCCRTTSKQHNKI